MICPHCWEEFETPAFDPGCNYGCSFYSEFSAPDCHQRYCSEGCYEGTGEKAEQATYHKFHAG